MSEESKKIKVLHVYPRLMIGGIERVILNLISTADHNLFSFGILTQEEGPFDDTIRRAGAFIFRIPFNGNKRKYAKELNRFFENNRFDVVHCHMHYQMSLVNKIASRNAIPCRIAHSHLSHSDWHPLMRMLRIPKFAFHESYATDVAGCTQSVIDWLFPKITRRHPLHIIPNNVDCERFKYDEAARRNIRNELGISESTKILLNLGRCEAQKNQDFILDLASSLSANEPILFLIAGDGALFEHLDSRIKSEKIDNVRLLGSRNDPEKLLSAADIYILPSTFEGLTVAAIEAMASGLPVIANPMLSDEFFCDTPDYYKADLSDLQRWKNLISESDILSPSEFTTRKRIKRGEAISESPHNAKNAAEICCEIYQRRLSNKES